MSFSFVSNNSTYDVVAIKKQREVMPLTYIIGSSVINGSPLHKELCVRVRPKSDSDRCLKILCSRMHGQIGAG